MNDGPNGQGGGDQGNVPQGHHWPGQQDDSGARAQTPGQYPPAQQPDQSGPFGYDPRQGQPGPGNAPSAASGQQYPYQSPHYPAQGQYGGEQGNAPSAASGQQYPYQSPQYPAQGAYGGGQGNAPSGQQYPSQSPQYPAQGQYGGGQGNAPSAPSGQQYPPGPAPTAAFPAAGSANGGWQSGASTGQQPYGSGPQGFGTGPQGPWTPAPVPTRGGGGRNRAVIGAVGGVAALALIGGGVLVWNNSRGPATPTPSPGQGTTSPINTTGQKPSDVVAAYLRALGAGDATTALGLTATPPSDSTFLTNAVLAKTTAGKIANVSVPEVSDLNATTVPATYTLNGKPVSTSFSVTNSSGQVMLNKIAAEVDLADVGSSTAPVTVAGVRAPNSVVNLFPGVYPIGSANKNFSYGSAAVTVTTLDTQSPRSAKVNLSSAGKSAVIKAAKSKYSWCLKQKKLAPSGCGPMRLRPPTGVKFRTSTIKWTTRGGAKWGSAKLKLFSGGVVEAAAKAKVHFYVRDANVSRRYWYKDVTITGFRALVSGSKVTVAFY